MSSASDKEVSNPILNSSNERYLNFLDPFNPFRIDNGDNPAAALVSDFLTADNYVSWSRAISRALRTKNKLGFINGTLPKSTDATDPLLEAWEQCNDLVVSWLQNSVSSFVKSSLALVGDSRILWLELQDRFTQQNGQYCISIYFGRLKSFWDELVIYDPLPDCDCGKLKILHVRYDRDCVIQFLMGLNDAYSSSRDQIMLIEPLPSLNRVFSMIQQQERQHLMLHPSTTPDLMAMMAKTNFPSTKPNQKSFPSNTQKSTRPYCTHCKIQSHSLENCFKVGNGTPPLYSHCNMTGHSIDKCYKLHGYPPDHKLHGKTKTSTTAAAASSRPFNTINSLHC
ncbi:hypothetical protein I3843_04G148200 [Carya illinoinensis]|nr:hypothetical protein I3843_04G148200 [Carya illinoinensis]